MAMMKTGVSSPPNPANEDGNVDILDPSDSEDEGDGGTTKNVGNFDWARYSSAKAVWDLDATNRKAVAWAKWETDTGRDRKSATEAERRAFDTAVDKATREYLLPQQNVLVDEVFEFYRNQWGFPYPLKSRDTVILSGDPEVDGPLLEAVDETYQKDLARYTGLARRLRAFESTDLLTGYEKDNEDYDGDDLFGVSFGDMSKVSKELAWNALGMGTASAFMPHMHHCPVKGLITPYDGFWGLGATPADVAKSRDCLKKAIRLALRFDSGAEPKSLRYGLRSSGGIQSVGNFKPTVAKFLWEWHTPKEGGIVYDYSCGWGGRLTGARSSKKNITYVGVDPSHETFNCLMKLDRFLTDVYNPELQDEHKGSQNQPAPYTYGVVGQLPSGHREYRGSHTRLTEMGSEDFCPPDLHGLIDFAFSSPPYFDLEQYGGNDPNQSHVKFSTANLWLTKFIRGTAENIFKLLKPGSFAGVNIADFRDTKICDGVIEQYVAAGFTYDPADNYYMRISVRTGNRSAAKAAGKTHKTETIFMFRKPE